MLRQDPCATSPSTERTIAGLWYASTSFDAAMPITPRCQPSPPTTSTLCAPIAGIGLDRLLRLGDQVGFLGLALEVLLVQLLGEPARFVARRFVGREQQAGRDVGRAHAAGGVDARREDEPDVVAVDRLAGQPGGLEQRAQADGVPSLAQRLQAELRDHAVLADQRDDVGERADRGDLDERRQPLALVGALAERLDQLQRDADAREVLVRIRCSRGASG